MNPKLKKRTKIALGLIPVYIIVGVLIGSLIYLSISYKPMTEALVAMESTSEITIIDGKKWITFIPTENISTTGFIFYPSGNVEPESYSIIARNIALEGFPVFIVKMPFDLAIFAPSRGGLVIDTYPEITDWVIGGHSLGGAMSARYLYESQNVFSGLVLLAAYPADGNNLSSYDIDVITIYGSEDGVLSKPISETLDLLPANTTVLEIVGGNHANFGSYGEQRGDNAATITRADQQNQTVVAITIFLLSL